MRDDDTPAMTDDAGAGPWLSIGALAKASGIPVETLRTWERRYDFPQPTRLPSGHRRYPAGAIAVLLRVRALLGEGHRASDLLTQAARGASLAPRSDEAARAPATATAPPAPPAPASRLADALQRYEVDDAVGPGSGLAEVLDAAYRLDAARVDRALSWQWQRRGGIGFLQGFCGPLLVHIGLLWRDGVFDVHHEHFVSERIRDFLVARAHALAAGAEVCVVAATISGERHVLGLHMAATALAMAGVGVVFLGADMPIRELATAAEQVGARAIVLSVSAASRPAQVAAQLIALRAALPAAHDIAVGGQGARTLGPIEGIRVLGSLDDLQRWAHALRAPTQETA